jgi:hypothetical protein
MKKFLIVGLALGVGVFSGLASGQEQESSSSWRWSLGANWRAFGEIEFKGFDFTPGDDVYVNGSVEDVGAGALYEYTVSNSVKQVDNVTLDTVEFQKAELSDTDDELGGAPGAVLMLSKPLAKRGGLTVGVEFSLSTAFMSTDFSEAAGLSAYQFDIAPNTWTNANAPAVGGGPDPDTFSETFGVYDRSQLAVSTTALTAMVSYDLSLDVYTLGAGLTLSATLGDARVLLGAGPALTIVDYDLERRSSAAWSDGSGSVFADRQSDHGTAVRGGAYVRLGLEWPLSDTTAIGFSGRYDYVAPELNTDTARLELSGLSGQLALTFGF